MFKNTLSLLFACLLLAGSLAAAPVFSPEKMAVVADSVPITFQVDMVKTANVNPSGAFLTGDFNGWVPAQMNNLGGGLFSMTTMVAASSTVSYKFFNGPSIGEPTANLAACGVPTGGGDFNRSLTTGPGGAVLPVVCFGSCEGCTVSVSFQVDMSLAGPIGGGGVFVETKIGGVLNSMSMTNLGNGIWSASAAVPVYGMAYYGFKNDLADEPIADLAACSPAGGNAGFYRSVTVNAADLALPTVCFGRCGACPTGCLADANALICDNFNGYSLAAVGPQAAHWTVWSGLEGGADDALVSNLQASDGGQSLQISGDTTGGQSLKGAVLKLGNKTTGAFELQFKLFQSAGKTAWFSFHTSELVPSSVAQVVLNPSGHGFLVNGWGQTAAEFDIPTDAWTDFKLTVDLSKDAARLDAAGQTVANFAWTTDLGAVSFVAVATVVEFFIDEIEFRKNALLPLNVDGCDAAFDLSPLFQAAAQTPGLTVNSTLFSNENSTVSPQDSLAGGFDCFAEDDFGGIEVLQSTNWFSFIGTGNAYLVETAPCNAGVNYIDGGDTQMMLYSGNDCQNLTPLDCNDDFSFDLAGDFRAGLVVPTNAGDYYRLMIDGYSTGEGQYCVQLTALAKVVLKVDAKFVSPLSPLGIHVQGSFDKWADPHPMTDEGAGIWSFELFLPIGDTLLWKFQNGPGGWEPDANLGACGVPNPFGGFDRQIIVTADSTMVPLCFGSCAACPAIVDIDDCPTAADLTPFFGAGQGVTSTTGSFSNVGATSPLSDPTIGIECFSDSDPLEMTNSVWFTFVGDGNTYQINTANCGGSNYLNDTQLAIFEGDCANLGESVACNDDTDLITENYASTVNLATEAGQIYRMLIDGWDMETGNFCIQITEIGTVLCGDATLGEAESEEISLCFDESTLILLDPDQTNVPSIGPISGFTWVISFEPIVGATGNNPFDEPGFFASTGISAVYSDFPFVNNGNTFQPGNTYYITPVLVAYGSPVLPGQPLGDLDGINSTCWIYGPSISLTLYDELDPLDLPDIVVVPETLPGNNGSISLTVSGGTEIYLFEWSNGQTGSEITGLEAGDYSVTISDESGCVSDFVLIVNVPDETISTGDPLSVKSLSLSPNPTGGELVFDLQLEKPAALELEILNALGQRLRQFSFEKTASIRQQIDLSEMPAGFYSLRFLMDDEVAVRRIVKQ